MSEHVSPLVDLDDPNAPSAADFLKRMRGEEAGGGSFHEQWKERGSKIIWLARWHTEVAVSAYRYMVPTIRDGKNDKQYLSWSSFNSPDPDIVHRNYYNRNDDGSLKIGPVCDPFLRLREWLRVQVSTGRIGMSDVVFEWEDPNPEEAKIIRWTAGLLADLIDKDTLTMKQRMINLRPQHQCLMVNLDHEKPELGLRISAETVTVKRKLFDTIKKDSEDLGRAGDPLVNPYPFKFEYFPKKSGSDKYDVNRSRRPEHALTEEILEIIDNREYPDPTQYTKPRKGDKFRIRDVLLAGAQIDLPLEVIFPDEWEDEDPAEFDTEKYDRQDAEERASTESPAPAKSAKTTRRRRRQEDARPATLPTFGSEKPVTSVQLVTCEAATHVGPCPTRLHPSWEACPTCGARWEIDDEWKPGINPPSPTELRGKWPGFDAPASAPSPSDDRPPASGTSCYACKNPLPTGKTLCPNCGMDNDTIPF